MPSTLGRKSAGRDRTFYPVDDGMGEGLWHRDTAELLRVLIQRLLADEHKVACVGANQFFYWVQGDPKTTVVPDVYVLPGVPADTAIECWKVWKTGIVPSLVVEVVCPSVPKDYADAIVRYRELGVREVIVFHRKVTRVSSRRVRWQIYRRVKGRGLVLVKSSNKDRVQSKQLGCWICMVGKDTSLRLRLGLGPKGDDLLPTEAEVTAKSREVTAKLREATARSREVTAKLHEVTAKLRAEAEAEAKAHEAEAKGREAAAKARAQAEVAAKARAQAEAEVARLQEELEELKRRLASTQAPQASPPKP